MPPTWTSNANAQAANQLELARRCRAKFRRLGVSRAVPCPIWARIMDELDERLVLSCGRVKDQISMENATDEQQQRESFDNQDEPDLLETSASDCYSQLIKSPERAAFLMGPKMSKLSRRRRRGRGPRQSRSRNKSESISTRPRDILNNLGSLSTSNGSIGPAQMSSDGSRCSSGSESATAASSESSGSSMSSASDLRQANQYRRIKALEQTPLDPENNDSTRRESSSSNTLIQVASTR